MHISLSPVLYTCIMHLSTADLCNTHLNDWGQCNREIQNYILLKSWQAVFKMARCFTDDSKAVSDFRFKHNTKLITWSSDSPTPFLQGHNFSKKIFPPTRQIIRQKKIFFFKVPLKIFHCYSSTVVNSNVDYSVLMYKNIYLRIKGND